MNNNEILKRAEQLYCNQIFAVFALDMIGSKVAEVSNPFFKDGYVCADILLSSNLKFQVYSKKVKNQLDDDLYLYKQYLSRNIVNQKIHAIKVDPDEDNLCLVIYTDAGYIKLLLGFNSKEGFQEGGILDRLLRPIEKQLIQGMLV
ncbi:hypothetical protein [Bacillus anthracis]|uniref:Uncharacterized protein n=1 Tax=Bacillus anthracis TaxID=1392 RepID=A0A0J1KNX3_BACAN|nr:hypothetical protein [Bacillus anthracis]KLV18360.1 hypothetical protein ABW01_13350 [Bacillus anthracis]